MKQFIKSVFKINLWFCAGILLLDTYGKIREIHNIIKKQKTIK